MRNEGLGSWPGRRARMTPDRTAVVFEGAARPYAELDGRVGRLASVLRERGVGVGGPGGLPRAEPSGVPGNLLRHGGARRGVRAAEHPARRRPSCPTCWPIPVPRCWCGPGVRGVGRCDRRAPACATGSPWRGEYGSDGGYEELLSRASNVPLDIRWPGRRLHDHVHLRDDRATEGGDAHPRQPDLELLQPADRPGPGRRTRSP